MSESSASRHRGLVLWGPFVEISESDLDRVEEQIGAHLPKDYRSFLLVAHGCEFPYAVRLPPSDPSGELVGFGDLASPAGPRNLVDRWQQYRSTVAAQHLPLGLLEVATSGGGARLYLDLSEKTFGAVWAYLAALPDWAGSREQPVAGQVAASWDAYLDLLTIDESYARDVWEDARVNPDDSWTAVVAEWLDSRLPRWRSSSWAH